jgi:SAM-dependent methyltransferase
MDEDVPSPIDLRDPVTAREWADEADRKRPHRARVRATIANLVFSAPGDARSAARVLELGAGPGQLAEAMFDHAVSQGIDLEYTLLDFSRPMLGMARMRLTRAHPTARVQYVIDDFKQPGWGTRLGVERFDAIVTMQAVHELRHKRHALPLYREARTLTSLLVVCDHEPPPTPWSSRFTPEQMRALCATVDEQHAMFRDAGFEPRTELGIERMYVVSGRARAPHAGT